MRIVASKTLKAYSTVYQQAEQALFSWFEEASNADWKNTAELKQQFRSASILSNKRVVFNIHGNNYRLIVDIEYRLKIVFIVWFGTHKQYDNIDAKLIDYVKAN